MQTSLEPLLRSTLVVIAHPDDETIGCGILLQRIARPAIVLCTDGVPDANRPWYKRILGRQKYVAAKRRSEFLAALRIAGIQKHEVVKGVKDQQLHNSLPWAATEIARAIREHRPEAILTHAYEAGHPDHDCCAFLAHWAGRQFKVPVWEMPFYFRSAPTAALTFQQFLRPDADEIAIEPTANELSVKRSMLSSHKSQAAVISDFCDTREVFRRQLQYNFAENPNPALVRFAVCSDVSIAAVLESFRSFENRATKVEAD